MNKLRRKLVFDLVLTVLLVVEMLFQLTGDLLHEVIGAVFFVTIVAHLVFSRKWISATSHAIAVGKKVEGEGLLRIGFGVVLAATMLVLIASSLAISNQLYILFGISLAGNLYRTWVTVHTFCSYLLCGLVVYHLAIHWAYVVVALRIPYNHERRAAINLGVMAIATLGVALVGSNGVDALSKPSCATCAAAVNGKGNHAGQAAGRHAHGNHGQHQNAKGTMSYSDDLDSDFAKQAIANGYCPLCPKYCPLSAPECNKPYAAGLI